MPFWVSSPSVRTNLSFLQRCPCSGGQTAPDTQRVRRQGSRHHDRPTPLGRWFTFNEARTFISLGYEFGSHPPFERGVGYVANKVPPHSSRVGRPIRVEGNAEAQGSLENAAPHRAPHRARPRPPAYPTDT